MLSVMKSHFLILALNEELNLKKTFIELKEVISEMNVEDYKISIVDDGSTDNTLNIANTIKLELDSNLEIIINKKNIGPANSVKKYINMTTENGKLFIISGDNDMRKDLIKQLIDASKKSDFVISCYLNREKKGWFKAHLSTTFNLIMCSLFNVYVFYLQGPSVWPIEIVRKMNISAKDIAYASEVNIKLLHSGLKFIEVAGYCNIGSERSTSLKFSSFVDIFRTILNLLYEIKFKKIYANKSERIIQKFYSELK
tara:strand:- start:2 stop:766 length:765 start_codon:yes stop_codon:yes gene_type:complete